ncbi:DUF397 domain-containing protein, partial [Sphaerisporangium rubeum]
MNSEAAGTETGPPRLRWRKSTYSNNGGDCVEVASNLPGIIGVRDSKTPTGPVVTGASPMNVNTDFRRQASGY